MLVRLRILLYEENPSVPICGRAARLVQSPATPDATPRRRPDARRDPRYRDCCGRFGARRGQCHDATAVAVSRGGAPGARVHDVAGRHRSPVAQSAGVGRFCALSRTDADVGSAGSHLATGTRIGGRRRPSHRQDRQCLVGLLRTAWRTPVPRPHFYGDGGGRGQRPRRPRLRAVAARVRRRSVDRWSEACDRWRTACGDRRHDRGLSAGVSRERTLDAARRERHPHADAECHIPRQRGAPRAWTIADGRPARIHATDGRDRDGGVDSPRLDGWPRHIARLPVRRASRVVAGRPRHGRTVDRRRGHECGERHTRANDRPGRRVHDANARRRSMERPVPIDLPGNLPRVRTGDVRWPRARHHRLASHVGTGSGDGSGARPDAA